MSTSEVDMTKDNVQEPVAWRYDLKTKGSFAGVSTEYSPIKLSIGENWTPLYTEPAAKRQWVGLTKEETEWCTAHRHLIEWANDKLKEKNT